MVTDETLDRSALADALADAGVDGYLLDADSDVPDQYYLSGFDASDPFVTLYVPDDVVLLVSGMEYGRARAESGADVVERWVDYDYRERVAEHGRLRGRARALAAFLDAHGVDSVAAPERFPLGTADGLRETGVDVALDAEDAVGDLRSRKTDREVDAIREAQAANERAMATAERLFREAGVEGGTLRLDGDVLTSERVKEEIEVALLREGYALDETIVACGEQAATPHDRGSGPLRAGEPIIVDIFPRGKESRYHGDMTRTFVTGDPTPEARAFYDAVEAAYEAGLAAVEPGATGQDVDDAVCDVFEDAGYATFRTDERTETGFIHSTGHGVGLAVHESPRLAQGVDEELEPGHVVTVEPGLYDPAVGGVRIEDLVVVTEDGHENLTEYPVSFEV